ncbi:succinate dehydrogenase assembly factor 2 [Dokdonella sp.]|uniref:FAD assembly factor SdhE n=1 Tax=Dokdonella sp. TaxID=2291710 RepID=UPI002F423E71
MSDDARLGRLRWRARRGTRELDRLLGAWLDRRYPGADEARRADFDALLGEADPDLWDWLTGHLEPAPRYVEIVDEIRALDRV